jgi:hypothetical protein
MVYGLCSIVCDLWSTVKSLKFWDKGSGLEFIRLRGSRPVLSCEKWKSQLLTLSDQNFTPDRPSQSQRVTLSDQNFVNGRSGVKFLKILR